MEQFSAFERGILLSAGGWEDQPDDYRQDMLMLNNLAAEEFNKLQATVSARR